MEWRSRSLARSIWRRGRYRQPDARSAKKRVRIRACDCACDVTDAGVAGKRRLKAERQLVVVRMGGSSSSDGLERAEMVSVVRWDGEVGGVVQVQVRA